MGQMSSLRRRMIEDMTVRNLAPATQQSYLYAVAKFSRHFARSPLGSAWSTYAPTRSTWQLRNGRGRTSTKRPARYGFSMV